MWGLNENMCELSHTAAAAVDLHRTTHVIHTKPVEERNQPPPFQLTPHSNTPTVCFFNQMGWRDKKVPAL